MRSPDTKFGNGFVIEVDDLLAQDKVLDQGRPPRAGLEAVLVVVDANALAGRQMGVGVAMFAVMHHVLVRFAAMAGDHVARRSFLTTWSWALLP